MTIENLQAEIERARKRARVVFRQRAAIVAVLASPGISSYELEFPEPDIMHAYVCLLGRRAGEPAVYRLIFKGERAVRWTGVSCPFGDSVGMKLADIEVGE